MKRGIKLVVLFLILFVLIIAAVLFFRRGIVFSPEEEPITYDNIETLLPMTSIMKSLPPEQIVKITFFNFTNGQKYWEKSYFIFRGVMREGIVKNEKLSITINSKYLGKFNVNTFCGIITEASKEGDIGYSYSHFLTVLYTFKDFVYEFKKCSQFSGSLTNFSLFEDEVMDSPIIEREGIGRINFIGKINISKIKNDESLLQKAFSISAQRIWFNTDLLPEFKSVPAELVFEGITMEKPTVLHNGVPCPKEICVGTLYIPGEKKYLVNVTGFSYFEVVENSSCGDGACLSGSGEDCNTCPTDCGSCPSTQSNSGSNGRSSSHGGSGGTYVGPSCTPQWSCSWGSCVDDYELYSCKKTNNCSSNIDKPLEQLRACSTTEKSNVNNSNTDSVSGNKTPKSLVFWFILAILIVAILVVAVMIVSVIKENSPSDVLNEEDKMSKAKIIVEAYRKAGYSEDQIKELFRNHGWSDENIMKILA